MTPIRHVLKIALLAMFFPVSASSATLAQWNDHAMSLIVTFEGSAYNAVTLDADCQGLSLGKKQHTVRANSIKEVFEEAIAKVGRDAFDRIIEQALGDKASEFQRLVEYSQAGSSRLKERMELVRSWQEIRAGSQWVALTEGPCANGASRENGVELRLKTPYAQRLARFLEHPTIVAAQDVLIAKKGEMALQRATCWALAVRGAKAPSFQEYLFFFDYLVQNGDSFTMRNQLQAIAQTIAFGPDTVAAKDDGFALQKMIQLREWLQAGFKNMGGGKPGHAQYAQQNAVEWMVRFEAGKISRDKIRLAYVGLMRAMLGNNQWGYTAMNRRSTIAFGGGTVNKDTYSEETMQAFFQEAGEIDASALAAITCI